MQQGRAPFMGEGSAGVQKRVVGMSVHSVTRNGGAAGDRGVVGEHSGARLSAAIIVFLASLVILRMSLPSSVHRDDADLVLFNQSLEFGYHEQPPLYSWLYAGVARVYGNGRLALSVLRSLLLATAAWCGWAALACLPLRRDVQLLGALSLLFLPLLSWYLVVYLTHSLLMCTLCLATLAASLRLHQHQRSRDYLLLGLVVGGGMLSKYNFVLFAGALLIAGMSVRRFRRPLWTPSLLVSIAAAVLVCLPHGVWLVRKAQMTQQSYAEKLLPVPGTLLPGGLIELSLNGLLIIGPTVALFAIAVPQIVRRMPQGNPLTDDVETLMRRYVIVLLALCAVCVVATGADRFHERWLSPLLVPLPVVCLCRIARGQPMQRQIRR